MRYEFTLTGTRPLLMHFDDVEWADEVSAWRLDPANTKKKGETSGDDRRPAWGWLGYCYHDGEHLAIPSANLTANFKKAGARVPLGRQRTCKELAVAGVLFEDEYLEFRANGKQVSIQAIHELREQSDFRSHVETVQDLGFRLYVKRASVGTAKHVRVRPRFDHWTVKGTLEVLVHEITAEVLDSIFVQAGRIGLGDWRPGSPKSPGPFGMFEHTLKIVK